MFKEGDFERKVSLKFLQTLNRHLPVKRKTLKELLGEDKPRIKNMDGSTHSFDKKELEKITSLLPEEEHDKLRLPLYLEMSSSVERGAVKISGRLECMVIRSILRGDEKPEKRSIGLDSMNVYYPHLAKIRIELPTTTQFMFTI